MKIDPASLKAKGWSDYEVHHAMEILRDAEDNKEPGIKLLEENIYWIFLFLAVIGNLAFTLALTPVIVTLPSTMLYIVTGFTAFMFGTLCTVIIHQLDKIDVKHHVFYLIFIPIAGILNFAFVVRQANLAVSFLGIGNSHSFIFLSITYIGLFFLPYALIYRRGSPSWI